MASDARSRPRREPTVDDTGTHVRAARHAAIVGVAWLVAFGLGFSPADRNQGESVRILYVHVPSAWLAYLAFIVTAVCSAIYLFRKRHSLGWDRLAGASAEIGVLFMGITLVTGMLWGRLTWGVFWEWDARLTTTAFLFVTYIGYLAVRRLGGTPRAAGQAQRRAGLLAVLEIPLVHWSVRLWRSLHQEATVLRPDGDVKMDGLMLFTPVRRHRRLHAALRVAGDPPPAHDGRWRTCSTTPGLDQAIAARRAEVMKERAAMEDAGFIIGSYVITFGAIAVCARLVVLRRAGAHVAALPDDAKPWT